MAKKNFISSTEVSVCISGFEYSPVIHENQNQYYFYQNGRIISEIPPQNVDDIAILEIYDRGTYNT